MYSPLQIKQINQIRILDYLRLKKRASRADLSRGLKLTRSTITVLTSDLLEQKMILETDETSHEHMTGRPGIYLTLNPSGNYFVGVEIGNEMISCVLTDFNADIIDSNTKVIVDKTPEVVVEEIHYMLNELRPVECYRIACNNGIGITVPAIINSDASSVDARFLKWNNIDLKTMLEKSIGEKFFIENDANAAALAEYYFSELDIPNNLFYLLLDLGVGGGLIVDNRIYKGFYGASGEIGHFHIPVMQQDGQISDILNWEHLIGKNALLNIFRSISHEDINYDEFCRRIANNDKSCLKTVQVWADRIYLTVDWISNLLNPGVIVIGGELSRFYPIIMHYLNEKYIDSSNVKINHLKKSILHKKGSIMGSVALVYSTIFSMVSVK